MKQAYEIQCEIDVSIGLIMESNRLMMGAEPNPRLLNLTALQKVLHSHVILLKDMLPKHGTTGQYQRGCRCELCIKAKADYNKEYKKLKGKRK